MPATESSPRRRTRTFARLCVWAVRLRSATSGCSPRRPEVALPPRVLGVLELLLDRAGDVVSRQELIDSVWKDAFVTDTSLAEAVSVLRQALGDDPQSPTYIQTVHRRGYRFVAPVSTARAGGTAVAVSPADEQRTSSRRRSAASSCPGARRSSVRSSPAVAVWQLDTRRRQPRRRPRRRFAVTLRRERPSNLRRRRWRSRPTAAARLVGVRRQRAAGSTSAARPPRAGASPGTEDGHAPFFSPDGRWIGFFADGRLKKVALAGGAPVTLADAPAILGGTWIGTENHLRGIASGGLMRVSSDGGESGPLTTPREADGEVRHAWPAIVPGTRILLFIVASHPSIDARQGRRDRVRSAIEIGGSAWRQLALSATKFAAAAGDAIASGAARSWPPLRSKPTGSS